MPGYIINNGATDSNIYLTSINACLNKKILYSLKMNNIQSDANKQCIINDENEHISRISREY